MLLSGVRMLNGGRFVSSPAPSGSSYPEIHVSEQAVIVKFDYGSTNLDALFELEDQLEAVLNGADVGEYDGHEIAVDGSDGLLYMYGPDADALYSKVKPTLRASTTIKNAVVTLRYGPPEDGVRESKVPIAG